MDPFYDPILGHFLMAYFQNFHRRSSPFPVPLWDLRPSDFLDRCILWPPTLFGQPLQLIRLSCRPSSLFGHPLLKATLISRPAFSIGHPIQMTSLSLQLSPIFGCPLSLAVLSLWLSSLFGYPISSAILCRRLSLRLGYTLFSAMLSDLVYSRNITYVVLLSVTYSQPFQYYHPHWYGHQNQPHCHRKNGNKVTAHRILQPLVLDACSI
jgi:hypothetical protein